MATPLVEARQIFLEAVEKHPPGEWPAFLDAACGGDSALRQRIAALLAAHGQFNELLDGEGVIPVVARPAGDQPGMVVGPYKLIEQIGEGGMGTVWMAQQSEPVKRLVAVKLIKAGMDSRQVIARFEAERQALALMDHANIARVLDAGTTNAGRPYFVMDLVRGVPITRYCDEHRLTPRQRLELFLPVCQAIQHAHQKGIIHRDLKPSNVLVALYDGQPVPKVIDFGVAKAAGVALTEKTLVTGFGAIVGTLEYMSPEQAEINQLDVDTRSDIYSLGVLLYELLSGTTPLERSQLTRSGMLEVLRIIREDEVPTLSNRLSTTAELPSIAAKRGTEPAKLTKLVRGELDWIVMKALEKDRNRRYATANSLAADVQRYLADEPVEACPPSAWYRFQKFARRHRRGLATASVVGLAIVLTAAISGLFIWQTNQKLRQALRSEKRGAYSERIALAEREWGANNLGRMEQLLEDCPEDLRGWEWRYLKRLRYGALPALRHESAVYSVAFSPDGNYLATVSSDGMARICQARTGQELSQWRAHEENATCVQFSSDSRRLATGSWDATVKVWDVQKVLQAEFNEPLMHLQHTAGTRVWSVGFRPGGGQRLASAGRTADLNADVRVWDLSTGQAVVHFGDHDTGVYSVRFSPDGRRLATAGFEDAVKVWDAETGKKLLTLGKNGYTDVAFSPDGRQLAGVGGLIAVHPDREVEVWDAWTGRKIHSLHGHVGALRCLAYSPDGRRLASAGLDQTIKLWDTATGEEVLTLRGHIDNIFSLAFSPDGFRLASTSTDKTMRVWDATPVNQEPSREYQTLQGHAGGVTDVAFHPSDERALISAGTDGLVQQWDFLSGQKRGALNQSPSAYRLRVAYCLDGRRLAVVSGGSDQKDVRVWDVVAAKEIWRFEDQIRGDLCVAFSPDGQHVATAGFDSTVRVWDAATGQIVENSPDHEWPVHGVVFSSDGRYVASCSADSTVRVWDWRSEAKSRILEPRHAARVANVAFSPDGKRLASASWDRTIKVWDTATWQLLHDLHDSPGAAAQCVAFGPGDRLAWGSTDSTIKVWDGPGTETQVLRGHTSWVQAVAFSRGGQWIASASLDGTVKIWKAPAEPTPEAQDAENRSDVSFGGAVSCP